MLFVFHTLFQRLCCDIISNGKKKRGLYMPSNNKHNYLVEVLTIIAGNLIIALGVTFFILPSNILSGGVAGISVAIQPIFHLPPRLVINGLTIGLYFLGALLLGKRFALKTIVSAVVYPIFISGLGILFPDAYVTSNPLLASIYAGICTGTGIGLVYRVGGSTGGMDIPPLIINKYTNIPLPVLVMCIDGATVLLGASTYGVEAAMIGLVSVWVCGQVINKVMTMGIHEAKNVMIITDDYEKMMQTIYQKVNRGATLLYAQGGYTREEKPVIMTVVPQKQFPVLNKVIQEVDPGAFVIISDVNEVQGEGFTYKEQI